MRFTEGLLISTGEMGIIAAVLALIVIMIAVLSWKLGQKSRSGQKTYDNSLSAQQVFSPQQEEEDVIAAIIASICMLTGKANTDFVVRSVSRRNSTLWRFNMK